MRIGIDVMGGDNAPHAILDGAVSGLSEIDEGDGLVLFGDERLIKDHIGKAEVDCSRIEVVGTSQVIEMDDPPVEAVRSLPDSSLVRLVEAAGRRASNRLDAVLSAGNTGAFVAAAQMHMRRLKNVTRPGIAAVIPTFGGALTVIDVGANIEPKPLHLAQYGLMGGLYARSMLGIENPRVALLNVGGEEQKGTKDIQAARELLLQVSELNFIGSVEGRGLFEGEADVVITDGVVGNVVLKLTEGLSTSIMKQMASEMGGLSDELQAEFQSVVRKLYAKYDYHEYGGAPLLGVNGVCLICHGSSQARTISNAVRAARKLVAQNINEAISDYLSQSEEEVVA